jgi:hypothetical protein
MSGAKFCSGENSEKPDPGRRGKATVEPRSRMMFEDWQNLSCSRDEKICALQNQTPALTVKLIIYHYRYRPPRTGGRTKSVT